MDETSNGNYALETFLGVLFLIGVIALLAVVIGRIRNTGRITVGEELPVAGEAQAAEGRVIAALQPIAKSDLVQVAPLHYALILIRLPTWAPIAMIIALLVPRDRVRLDVVLSYREGAVWARLSGVTEKDVLARIRQALAT